MCLCGSDSGCGMWLLDLSLSWHYICPTFSDFLRLTVIHLGLLQWPYALTSYGVSPHFEVKLTRSIFLIHTLLHLYGTYGESHTLTCQTLAALPLPLPKHSKLPLFLLTFSLYILYLMMDDFCHSLGHSLYNIYISYT